MVGSFHSFNRALLSEKGQMLGCILCKELYGERHTVFLIFLGV